MGAAVITFALVWISATTSGVAYFGNPKACAAAAAVIQSQPGATAKCIPDAIPVDTY